MTLLNASALFAAIGLLVPIVIHLHRKRKARVIEWPAMQFLTNTMASRRRGLALENLLLLFVRCLVIALFVLAVARPLMPANSSLPVIGALVLMTGGLIGLAVAVIRSFKFRTRVAGSVAAIVLLGGAAATIGFDPGDLTSPTGNCDLVIVLDETSSMLVKAEHSDDPQASPFAAATHEALRLVDQLSGSSTVSIVRCGPVIETMEGSPFRDLRAARKLLAELQPTGGGASTGGAVDQAIALAKKGPNAHKQVVLFTDNQLKTWESFEESRRQHATLPLGESGSQARSGPSPSPGLRRSQREGGTLDDRVHLAVHLANLPEHAANISVVNTRIKSAVPAVGKPLFIEAEVRNHGHAAVAGTDIQLAVDGKPVKVETINVLPAASSTTVRFPYTFESAGEHVVTARTELPDAMTDDNQHDTVVSVVPFVSVLLINGNAFAKPGDQSATFLQLSLDPISRTGPQNVVAGRPIRVESVVVPELEQLESLKPYDVIVLSEVPQLPADIAARISAFVRDGGGLWVIPDQQANTSFYNDWMLAGADTPMLPATLMNYQQAGVHGTDDNTPRTSIDLQTTSSGFVSDLIQTGEHDLTEVVVSGYRRVSLNDAAVAGMKLTTGDPLFAEHAVGQGRVLLQTVALGRQESNLPQRVCFPVLMHLWSYDLADCRGDESNFEPSRELSVPLSLDDLAGNDVDSLLLTDPAGEEQTVSVVKRSQGSLAQVGSAARPGVYALNSRNDPKASRSFTVARDHRESDLSVISQEKLNALQSGHDLQWFENAEQLRFAGVAEVTEHEISPHLLLAVLCLIAAESLLAAWIRSRRSVPTAAHSHSGSRPGTVDFIESPVIGRHQPATLPLGELGSQPRIGPSPSLGLRPSQKEGGMLEVSGITGIKSTGTQASAAFPQGGAE